MEGLGKEVLLSAEDARLRNQSPNSETATWRATSCLQELPILAQHFMQTAD